MAYALAGNPNKAYQIATRLLDGARSGDIPGANALGIGLNLKAALAVSTGRFSDAVPLIEESQLSWEATVDSPHKAASRNNQAVVYAMLPKKYAGAETQFDGATILWRDIYGSQSAHVAGSRNNLGVLAISQNRFAEAEDRLHKSLELARQNFSAGSPGLFASLNALTRLNTLFGRFPEASQFEAEAKKSTGLSPQLQMAHQAALGALLGGQGAYRDAAGSFGKALAIGKQVAVPEHVFLGELSTQKVAIASLHERLAQTVTECQSAIENFDKELGADHPLVARTSNVLGWEYIRSDKKPEARKQFKRAQQIFAANRNEVGRSWDEGQTLAGLAQTFGRREWNEGVNLLRDAVAVETEVFSPALGKSAASNDVDTPRTADYLFDEALLYTATGGASNETKAADLFERVMVIRERLLPKTHPALAATYENYAKLLQKLDKKEQAAAMEKKAERARELAKRNH